MGFHCCVPGSWLCGAEFGTSGTTNHNQQNRIKNLVSPFCFPVFALNLLLLALCFSSLYQVLIPFRTLWLLSEKGMSYFQVPQNPDRDTLVRHDQLSVRKQFFFFNALLPPSLFSVMRYYHIQRFTPQIWASNSKIWGSVENFSF